VNDTVSDLDMESSRDNVPNINDNFVDEELEFGVGMSIRGVFLYSAYRSWCRKYLFYPDSFYDFKAYLLNNYPVKFSEIDFVNVRLK